MKKLERGTSSIEAAVVIPVLLIFILVVVAAGRVAIAKQTVASAAQSGARAASLERSAGAAKTAAAGVAQATLSSAGVTCTPNVATDTSGFGVTPGQAASVTTTINCSVPLADLALPGLPGSIDVSSSATSVLDTYRGRTGS